jgi:hypothetical protein
MFTFVITTKSGNITTTQNANTLLKMIQKQRVVAMDKSGFEYIAGRIAKSPKSSWIKGLAAAALIEYTAI